MVFDAHYYYDPAINIRYERETLPCFGCVHRDELWGAKFCLEGKTMLKRCLRYKEVKIDPLNRK